MKKVSCICVTYNRPVLLPELLYCFLQQDYKNKELIIVNDQVNVTYEFDHPEVKIINLDKRFDNLGDKRNYAKRQISSDGEYVFWLDDDDIYYPDHLSFLIKIHEKNLNFDKVEPKFVHFSKNNKLSQLQCRNVGFPTSCYKRSYVDKTEFLPLAFGSDQPFAQGAKRYKIRDDKVTAHVRWGMNTHHVSGMSRQIGNKDEQKRVWETIGKRGLINNKKSITLVPELRDRTKEYYRIYN